MMGDPLSIVREYDPFDAERIGFRSGAREGHSVFPGAPFLFAIIRRDSCAVVVEESASDDLFVKEDAHDSRCSILIAVTLSSVGCLSLSPSMRFPVLGVSAGLLVLGMEWQHRRKG